FFAIPYPAVLLFANRHRARDGPRHFSEVTGFRRTPGLLGLFYQPYLEGHFAAKHLLGLLLDQGSAIGVNLLHVYFHIEAKLEDISIHRDHLPATVEPGAEFHVVHAAAPVEFIHETLFAAHRPFVDLGRSPTSCTLWPS